MTAGNVRFLTPARSALPSGLGFTQKVLKASTTGSQTFQILGRLHFCEDATSAAECGEFCGDATSQCSASVYSLRWTSGPPEWPEAVKLSSRPLEIAPPENVGEDDTRVYADSLNFIPAIGDTKTRRVVPPGPEIV
jgi:hypothetical protein